MNEEKLFVYLNGDDEKPLKYSAFGFPMSTIGEFYNTIKGYKIASEKVYAYYQSLSEEQIDELDTLVFPLCYLYRHTIELYIKYLYGKYASVNREEYHDFLSKCGHHLLKAWEKTKPHLQGLIDRFPSSGISLNYIHSAICEFDNFDPDSFRMRYPVTKKLTETNPRPILLDVVHLHDGMEKLYNQLDQLDCFFDNVIVNNEYSSSFKERFNREISNADAAIQQLLSLTSNHAEEIRKNHQSAFPTKELISLGSFLPDAQETIYEDQLSEILSQLGMDELSALNIFLYTGRDLVTQELKLSELPDQRKKDLLRGLELTCEDFPFDQPETRRSAL